MPATRRYTTHQSNGAFRAANEAASRLSRVISQIVDDHDATRDLKAAIEQCQIALEWMPGTREPDAATSATLLMSLADLPATDSDDIEWLVSGDFVLRYPDGPGAPMWGRITGRWSATNRRGEFDTGDYDKAPSWVHDAVLREYMQVAGDPPYDVDLDEFDAIDPDEVVLPSADGSVPHPPCACGREAVVA